MPRRKRIDKRRHEVTLELRCVLANMGAYHWHDIEDPELSAKVVGELWAEYWGSPGEARLAFEALRDRSILHAVDGQTYEAWLASFLEPDPRRADESPEDDGEDNELNDGDEDELLDPPDTEETD